jgi:sterol desaturase/sphingolipid hydroxylase (fatty acid hydroxylase superfamily)
MRWLALPCTFAATFALALLLVAPLGTLAAVTAATLGLAVALLFVERCTPNRPDWRAGDGLLTNDLLHLVFGFLPGNVGGAVLAAVLFEPLGSRLAAWPRTWPMAAQVALGLVLFEFGSYWQHRLVHEVPWLWRFHSLHHTPHRLVLLKSTRIHALDLGSAALVSMAPLCLLGADVDALAWVTLVTNVNALVQHANVPMPVTPLAALAFATPQTHRSHHSLERACADRNYGMNLMVFDRLFGTFDPPTADTPARVGVEGDDGPVGFVAQTLGPLWPARLRRTTKPPTLRP